LLNRCKIQVTNSRLRKEPIIIEDESVVCKSKKKNLAIRKKRKCPFCLYDIYKQYKNEEKKLLGLCKNCGAIKNVLKICSHCKSDNVWQKDDIFICKNCGKNSNRTIVCNGL